MIVTRDMMFFVDKTKIIKILTKQKLLLLLFLWLFLSLYNRLRRIHTYKVKSKYFWKWLIN